VNATRLNVLRRQANVDGATAVDDGVPFNPDFCGMPSLPAVDSRKKKKEDKENEEEYKDKEEEYIDNEEEGDEKKKKDIIYI
jgi:hypothetical protein